MNLETKIALGVALGMWALTGLLMARRSRFRTYLKYLDALVFLPLLVVLLPPSVYALDRLAPLLRGALDALPLARIHAPLANHQDTLATALALVVVALGPAVVFYGWRRLLAAREAAILTRRAASASG